MNRREFISGMVAAGAAGGLSAAEGSTATDAAAGQPLKVCVFSDIHYERGFWANADDPTFLEKILARAERESCDMMIQCGDFMHGVAKPWQKEFMKLYNEFMIPGYHVLGNHDQEQNSAKETCDAYRIATSGHYSFDRGGFRFVIADPNYFCPEPGKYVHYERSNYARAHGRKKVTCVHKANIMKLTDGLFLDQSRTATRSGPCSTRRMPGSRVRCGL